MENYKKGNRSLIYAVLVVVLCYLLFSCDITKQSNKSKTDTDFIDKTEKKVFRAGDTVKVPSFNVTYKDTTIYTTNRQGTTIRTIYDVQGQIKGVECYASRIEEITKMNVQLQQQLKEKSKQKVEKSDTNIFLYIIIGLVVVLCFTVWLIYKRSKSIV